MSKAFLPLLLSASLLLSGCWDYRGLDELSIVAGIAIDRSENNPDHFVMSFEVINSTASVKNSESQTTLLESEGETLLDALYLANKRLFNQLYLSNTELLIVSEDLAADAGLDTLIEGFLRDPVVRDNMIVVVSRAETARELIEPQGNGMIISYEINKTLNQTPVTTNPTKTMQMYQIYNAFRRETSNIVLPAFSYQDHGGIKAPKMDGLAVFDWDTRLQCYLEETQVSLYHYLTEGIEGNSLTFKMEGDKNVVMSVAKSHQTRDYRFEDGRLHVLFRVGIETKLYRVEAPLDVSREESLRLVEERAEEAMNVEMEHLIRSVQQKSGLDPFGISTTIYRKDPQLWSDIKDRWEEIYRDAEIRVESDVTILNTGWAGRY